MYIITLYSYIVLIKDALYVNQPIPHSFSQLSWDSVNSDRQLLCPPPPSKIYKYSKITEEFARLASGLRGDAPRKYVPRITVKAGPSHLVSRQVNIGTSKARNDTYKKLRKNTLKVADPEWRLS